MRPETLGLTRARHPLDAARLAHAVGQPVPKGGASVGALLPANLQSSATSFVEIGVISTLIGLLGGMFVENPWWVTIGGGTLVTVAFGASDLPTIGAAYGGSYLGARLAK